MTHTKESLIAFEQRVADAFAAKQIHAPIHLCSDTQAQPLIDYFRENVGPDDWCLGTWRSHFMALLRGIPEDELFNQILDGRSMFVCSRKHRVLCSAIVGGILPIATGIALGIKRSGGSERVHVFVGDMCARTGLFHEFHQYCSGHDLPVAILVEDNSYSTNADTRKTWGMSLMPLRQVRYSYQRTWPHTGLHKRVAF